MRLFLAAAAFCSSAFGLAQYPGSDPVPPVMKKGFDAVTVEEAKRILTKLAGPDCQGRGTGSPGYAAAAAFIATEFRKLGLKPAGDMGSYFQNVRFAQSRANPKTSNLSLDFAGRKVRPARVSWTSGAAVDVEGSVLLVRAKGRGARLPGDVDPAGRVVILASDVDNPFLAQYIFLKRPAALLMVKATPKTATWRVSSNMPDFLAKTAQGEMSFASSAECLAGTPDAAFFDGIAGLKPDTAEAKALSAVGKVHLEVERQETPVPNVAAILVGSDPKLKNEVVVVSAHLDHLGANGAAYFPGADDDGSGSAAVLLVAQALKAQAAKLKRSVLFVTFCGEEMGLVGSQYYVQHPLFPLKDTVCDLQMDMVGREAQAPPGPAGEIRLIGTERYSKDLRSAVEAANKHLRLRFLFDMESMYGCSDHASFGAKGVPTALLFDGFHEDLHSVGDTVDKIDWLKLTSAAKLIYLVASELANGPRPKNAVQ